MSPDPARTLVHRLCSRPRMTRFVMWVAAAALCAAPVAAQQQGETVTASSPVVNRATATYDVPGGGTAVSADSAAVAVSFTVGVHVSAGGSATVRPGGSVVLPHRVANTGQRVDLFALTTTLPADWQAQFFHDADGDGAIGAGDTLVTSVRIPVGESLPVLVRVIAPADAADSSTATVGITARSRTAAAAVSQASNTITVVGPRAILALSKGASVATAAHGDTIGFTLTARNAGDAASGDVVVADTLPAAMTFVPGTLARDGVALPDTFVTTISSGAALVRVPAGTLAPGAASIITFRVSLATGTSGDSLANQATAFDGVAAPASGRAAIAVRLAKLDIAKTIVGDTLVPLGGRLTYRLQVTNSSDDVTARDIALTDSLPAELQFVSGEGAPAVNGQVVTWTIPQLAPGASLTRDLVVRVLRLPASGDIVNRAAVNAVNATASTIAAARTVVERTPGAALALTKTVGVLEVGLGESVPYVMTLRNRSVMPLGDLVVHDLLPDGMELAGRMVRGADSIRVVGRDVYMYVAGPLAPSAEHVLRYNGVLTSARARTATNRASATADAGRVASDTALAMVRVRRGFEVENRTLVGKVWLDVDDDGRQDDGEPGVAGVDVWMSDGAVVTTDREGRFSMRDIATGQHALRVDMSRIPSGMRLPNPDEDMVLVRADGWTLPLVDIRLVPDSGAKPCICPDTLPRTRDLAVELQGGEVGTTKPVSDALLLGPTIRFMAPETRTVVHTARIYVGARGEPGQPVRLYDGDSLVAEAMIRGDGVHDFIGVPLTPGPHVLRLWTRNTWGNERWDSLAIHRSGPATAFLLDPGAPSLHPDRQSERLVRVRVLDQWGQPVAEGTQVTLEASGAAIQGEDTDRSSLGLQRRVAADGWVSFSMRGGPVTGPAVVKLRSGAARGTATLPVLPVIHSLIVMGNAEIGVGATTPSYGAITARGSLDDRTAVTVSVDTRRASDEDETFARIVDPMQSNQYPTLGDGSSQASHGTGSGSFTARVERDYDWVEFGDITPHNVTGSARLFDYRRALTGAQGRVTVGGVVIQGFGSVTSQQLQERQIAATSGSGPYALGSDLRPGTERIVIEVRARENAARIVDRRELVRVTDYEIDYTSGALLLRRPLASMDATGNPVFIVAYVERVSGGTPRFVGGGRIETGLDQARTLGVLDSATVAVSVIHDASGGATNTLTPALAGAPSALDVVGTDVMLQRGSVAMELTVLRSSQRDTAALASRAMLSWTSGDDRFVAGAEWTRVAPGFGGGLDPRLASGFRELRLSSGARLGRQGRIELVHEQQYFEQYGVDRQNTYLRAEQRRAERALSQEIGLLRDGTRAGPAQGGATTARGRLELSATERASLWLEANRALGGDEARLQPDRFGVGAGYRLFGRTRLETTHFLNRVQNGDDYSTSALNLRTETPFGGRAWGGVERASAARASHAALLGIEQRFRLAHGWEVQSTYERRMGLDGAPLEDPSRALPFAQPERDRSLLAIGMSFLPGADRGRLTVRSELQDGADQRGFRLAAAGDVPLGPDAALLVRSDWSQFTRSTGTVTQSRQDRSLMGYAFRPTGSNTLNMLAKVEWRRTLNPLGTAALIDSAESRRMIATSDAIWLPEPKTEVAVRYAVRWADWRYAGVEAPAAPIAHYSGLRVERAIAGRFGARLDGRLLHEQSSGVSTWALAPSLTYRLSRELRFEAGYRSGTLQDLDFGESRSKLFATVGLHFTERSLAGAAAFWRDRLSSDR